MRLRDLTLLKENARYMPEAEFAQLVENLRRDGRLTSVPLVYRGTVLSGNHRVQAAIEAGIEEADAMLILDEIDEERQLAIQLSHNAINGRDDPNILAKLYGRLTSLELRRYSGLNDDAFKVDEAKLAALGVGRPEYEELVLLFLPAERAAFEVALERIERAAKSSKRRRFHLAARETFDGLFEAIVAVKEHENVLNNAVALQVVAELALEAVEGKKRRAPKRDAA